MSVKSSISLSEEQDAFARKLVESGHYSSVSAVLQHGIEMLRAKVEDEALDREALRTLLLERMKGPFISGEEMDKRIEAMIARKRRDLGL
jgi:antitoxin ParD1/3/4